MRLRSDSVVVVLLARLHAEAEEVIVIERPPDGPVVIREAAFGAIAAIVGGPRQVDVKRHGNGDDEGADSQDAPPGGAEEESGSDGAEQPAGHDRARERDRESQKDEAFQGEEGQSRAALAPLEMEQCQRAQDGGHGGGGGGIGAIDDDARRSEEPTSELQSLMRISYAVFCLKKKKQ